jgi:hypothetical protein
MSGRHHTIAAAAAAVSLLTGCAALPASTANQAHIPPPTGGRAANGLPYSTASADKVQAMPAPGACHYRGTGLFAQPDPHCAPGALNPAVTQADIGRTICRPGGYTASVRPAGRVTEPEKRALMAAYGNHAPLSRVELDHVVSLSAGGAANDPRNYYPEKRGLFGGAEAKDRLENLLHRAVCSRRMSLARAQAALAHDWPAAYRRYVR